MVTCSECGLLYAIADNGGTVREVNDKLRVPPIGSTGGWIPHCAARVVNLAAAYRELERGRYSKGADAWNLAWTAVVLDEDRAECEGSTFVEYRPGLGVKEHQEMLDRQRLLEWQVAQEKDRREWESYESRLNREHQQRLSEDSDRIQSNMATATIRAARYQLSSVFVAAVGVIAAVSLALVVPRCTDTRPIVDNTIVVTTSPTPDLEGPPTE